MNWQRSGELGMVSEPYRVGKFFIDSGARYGLFFNHERLGWFDTFEECQVAAEEHSGRGEAPGVDGGETVGEVINVLADRREPIGEASSPKGDGRAAGSTQATKGERTLI